MELTDDEQADLARISSRLPALETAWKLKEALGTWYATAPMETAEAKLDDRIQQVREHGPEPMQQALSILCTGSKKSWPFFAYCPRAFPLATLKAKTIAPRP